MKLESGTAVTKMSKLSLLGTTALIAGFGFAPMAYAQDNGDTEVVEDEIVITGIRQSLKEARDLKRDADTAIDSITASDVGSLPDLSVAEALSRIPGVVAQRFDISNNNGGDFPSPEGGGNLIRGLTLVRSEFNGREAFSANGGRALDFGTVPPELIGAVDVYKNTTADQIEGGIGGSINLRTLEPFDQQGLLAVINADVTYTDLREEWSPEGSILLGNRWETGAGEFGLLGSIATSELQSELHGFQIGQVIPFNTGTETIAIPNGFQLRTNEVNRQRDSYYLAGQWQNASGDLRLTGKYSRIENDTDSDERTLEYFGDGESFGQYDISGLTSTGFSSNGIAQCNGSNEPTPANPTCEVTLPVTGLYETGVISNGLRDWTGARGANFTNLAINQVDKSTTDDLSLNLKWRPTDRLYVNLDAHRTTADFSRVRLWGGTRFFSDFTINADLDNPEISLVPDVASNPFTRSGTSTSGDGDFSNPQNSYLLFAADEFQDNDGEMYAVKGDVEYEFGGDGWFDSVQFGARYADRNQTNQQAGLNWAAVAPPWAGGGYLPYAALDESTYDNVEFSDFFRGGVVQGTNTNVLFTSRDLLRDYDAFSAFIAGEPLITDPANGRNPDWNPLRDSSGVVDYAGRGIASEVTEKTLNLYSRLDFGQEFDNGMSLEGNIGLRYVRAEVSGEGGLNYADVRSLELQGGGTATENDLRLLNFAPETVAFLAQPDESVSGSFNTNEHWLPSFNAKWNITDKTLLRAAASKQITRPRIDQLNQARTAVGNLRFVSNNDQANPEILDIIPTQITVFGGNPDLKAIESTNLDLSVEHYYGDDNSFTFNLFHKDISNNIVFGSQTVDTVTLDGQTVAMVFNGDVNQDEAQLTGIEVAIQHFFDDLPGILGNLGVQANYTYIDADAVAPAGIVDADGDGTADSFERIYRFGVDNFLGLSEDAVNLIGIYQDDKLEMRLAYNWRSEYLGSYRDFVSGNPVFQQATGYLDGSIKYDVTENFQVRAQIANITNEEANAEQQIDADGQRFGRTSFVGDRRIKIGARYKF
ncbi:MAG: TonB-dependent receptor [Litorimonas sp.]